MTETATKRTGRKPVGMTTARARLFAAMLQDPEGNLDIWARMIGRAVSSTHELMRSLVREGFVIEQKQGSLWSKFRPAPEMLQATGRCPLCAQQLPAKPKPKKDPLEP